MEKVISNATVRPRALLLLAGLALLALCGCQCMSDHSYTYNVWQGGTFFRPHSPAPAPKLAVAKVADQHDFVISYDEQADRTGDITRRSYLARANKDASERGRKPAFLAVPVNPPQPVMPSVTATNATFTIHTVAGNIGPQTLPTYAETSGTTTKILLTPLDVVGDVTILTFILAFQAALNPGNWHH